MKMASKQPSSSTSCGFYVLAFLTIFNFATLLGIVGYHVFYVNNQSPTELVTGTKDLVNQVIGQMKSEFKSNDRRRSASQNDPTDTLLHDILQAQNSELLDACRSTCKQEVVTVLKDAVDYLKPIEQHKRQLNTAGNELANIFGEIAKSEIDILNQYCSNGSAICLPGQKGDQGMKGDPGADGARGPPGPKGDKGDIGLVGGPVVSPVPQLITPSPADACCIRLGAPQFITQREEIRVPEGTDLSLPCKPTGYPEPAVQWKWSPAVPLDKQRSLVMPENLSINNARVNDSRLYTCSVENVLGQAQKEYSVQVFPHINFEELPQNATVLMGTQVIFECKVDGPLNPAVTWYKVMKGGNRLEITQDVTPITHGSQLVVTNANTASSGEYVCVGDNGVEKIETSAYLHIYGPPEIIPPGTVSIIKGQTVVLTCDTISYPPATISWSYPPGVTNAYINNNGSLVILNAQTKDATTFFCTATNTYGSDKDSVSLQVKVPAEATVTPVVIPLGSGTTTIAVQCSPGGDPPLIVSFAKDGQPVTSDGHILTLPGNVLLVNAATQKDVGEYTCIVSNSVGSSQASAYAFKDVLGTVSCSDTFSRCTDRVCGATCPANCLGDNASVFGVNQYSMTSSICRAGIQYGAITDAGGQIVWVNGNNSVNLAGTIRNGVSSNSVSLTPGSLTAVPIVLKP